MKKFLLALFFPILIFAAENSKKDFSRFAHFYEFEISGIVTPKIVKFVTENFLENGVLIDKNGEILPHKIIRKTEKISQQKNFSVETSSNFSGSPNNLIDGDATTNFAFHPEKDLQKKIILNFDKKTEVAGIFVRSDFGIIPPKKISVRGKFDQKNFVKILDKIDFSPRIPFPAVEIFALEISFDSLHFLRISEIEILGQQQNQKKDELLFFAKEGEKYRFFTDAHFGQKFYRAEKFQKISADEKTPIFSFPKIQKNQNFDDDFDDDGIADEKDLCPKIADEKNLDADKNGRGDACEDPDLDGIFSQKDNCPFKYNPAQKDADLDRIGDECDDTENRATENAQFLLWFVFAAGAGVLLLLIFRSFKK